MVTRGPGGAVPVLTVDDYLPFHAIARRLVRACPGFVSAGEFASGREACRAIEASEPGLVLMDVHMPDLDGIAVTRWIRRRHHNVVVVLISTDEPTALPSAAFGCGAAAVLRKQDLRPSVLVDLWRTHGPR
jgi:DNA-binding NarL/FixJ family response regulator